MFIDEEGWTYPTPSKSIKSNCRYIRRKCTCGIGITTLYASMERIRGETLVAATTFTDVSYPHTLVVRFDGSCKAPGSFDPRAGAGVAVFIADEEGNLNETRGIAWPLPWAKNAQMAEALGSRLAVKIGIETIRELGSRYKLRIQGDNQRRF